MTDDNSKMCKHCITEIDQGEEYTWCPADCLPVGGKFDASVYSYISSGDGYPEKQTQVEIAKALGASRQQVNRTIKKLLQKKLITQEPNYFGSLSYTTDSNVPTDRPNIVIDTLSVAKAAVEYLKKKAEDPENLYQGKYLRISYLSSEFEYIAQELAWLTHPDLSLEDPIIIYGIIHPIMRKADEVRRRWQNNPKYFMKTQGGGWLVNTPLLLSAEIADNGDFK